MTSVDPGAACGPTTVALTEAEAASFLRHVSSSDGYIDTSSKYAARKLVELFAEKCAPARVLSPFVEALQERRRWLGREIAERPKYLDRSSMIAADEEVSVIVRAFEEDRPDRIISAVRDFTGLTSASPPPRKATPKEKT